MTGGPGALGAFQQYLLQRVGEQVVLGARRRLIRRMLRLPMAEYDHRRPADLVPRLTSDATMLRVALAQGLVAALGAPSPSPAP
ncbi:ABC transporter transmembrane domain-containing protein [uncultured Propionibacterium sp.]|uniref:ABC transporter transmembrane domain-containing protein n=1 Tax=uncultured Propionibacterium sp. TaxID=218066 RepID=UPI0029302E14|nr:ABC transporter transmembrane domain-containing protein [uncultured Propionibacterium sp.]